MLRRRRARWVCIQTAVLAVLMVSCNRSPCPAVFTTAATLPFGFVDTPPGSHALHDKVRIAGWALAEAGIQEVLVYVDGNFVTLAKYGLARPDVARVHPQFPDSDNAAWEALLDPLRLPPGTHQLTIQARAKDGASRDLIDVPVTIARN